MVAGLAVTAIAAAFVGGFLASGFGIGAMLAAGFLAGSTLPIVLVAGRLQVWRGEGRAASAVPPVGAALRRG